jgi:sigma-B regulation protein RsbU (phosphoserine phosphatase)
MTGDWQTQMKTVVDLMRGLSRETDPQKAAQYYIARVRKMFPADRWVSVSRRGMPPGEYLITRSSTWDEEIDPWRQRDRLPRLKGGLLGELIYSEEPQVIHDLASRLKSDDPGYDYLKGMKMLITLPMYDEGTAQNMLVQFFNDPSQFSVERYPTLMWQANLWGRGTLNLALRRELSEALESLDSELDKVGEMQRSLLPSQLPKIDGLQLAADYQTSQRAGGDYYDVFDCGDGRWGLLIADVSGHGTPAAVIMAVTHAIAHLHPGTGEPPGNLLSFVDRQLSDKYTNDRRSFVTAFYGIYDPRDRSLTYSRAGHNPPRFMRGGIIEPLDGVGGLPLGMGVKDERYFEKKLMLKTGDDLLFYTDGITEARNPARDMFGVERLDAAMLKPAKSAQEKLKNVLADLAAFTGPAPADDDRTLVAARVV